MGWGGRSSNNTPTALTDMQKRYEAETGSTMFSNPSSSRGGRFSGGKSSKDKKAFEEWSKATAGMDAGKNRFNEMMANRSQNPVLGQTQSGMSGFDQFQAMQAAGSNPQLMQSEGSELLSILVPSRAREISAANDVRNQQAGYDRFQAMQAARDNTSYQQQNPFKGLLSGIDMSSGPMQDKMQANAARQRSEQGARFNAAMGANPLILQQLQMGQRQMGPQFNAFGFGAQPGLAAQGGQGGSILANMSSQGMNQLAAGQQNNPTIFKAKS
jgi:uncharacterized protein YktA (UPF0223 family)